MTDLERAARFLYLQRTAFGGKVEGRNFGVSVGNPGRFDVNRLGPILEDVHQRLSGVVIERLPFDKLIERYDRQDTLFYLGPPYYGKGVFGREHFGRLAAILAALKGEFMLSINDRPQVRALFAGAGFQIEAVETSYTVGKTKSARFGELLITRPGSKISRSKTSL